MATEEDRINTGALLTIGAVLAISVVAVAFAVTALVRNEAESITSEKGSTANLRPLRDLREQHTQALGAPPGWVDKESNQVSLPIERAKQLVLEDIRKDPGRATAPPPPDAGAPKTEPDAAAPSTEDGGAPTEETTADGGAENAPAPEPEGTEAPKPKPPKPPKPPPPPEPPAPEVPEEAP